MLCSSSLHDNTVHRKLIVWGWMMTLLLYLVCVLSPWGEARLQGNWLSLLTKHLSIFSQSGLIVFAPILSGCLLASRWSSASTCLLFGTGLIPALFLIHSAVVQWLGVPLFSSITLYVITHLGSTLLPFTTAGMAFALATILVIFGLSWTIAYRVAASESVQRKIATRRLFVCFVLFIATFALINLAQTYSSSAPDHPKHISTRFPFAVLRACWQGNAEQTESDERSKKRGQLLEPYVIAKERQLRLNAATFFKAPIQESPPDILIIVLESLRSELLTPKVMPHTSRLAAKGMTLRSHFSGGNSTSLGIFSLVSGLEANWFYRSEPRHAPAMNDLFRQAGYELGLFAGQNDWEPFQMEGFMNDRVYDTYRCEPRDGLDADRLAIARTEEFLSLNQSGKSRPPRLAVLFLYSTHAPFYVDDHYEIFKPSAKPSFLMPFTESMRQSVWNRYRNAAHGLDAMIESLLRPDRIIVVTGDHGESFLEDGSIGHGTRLSRQQTMTPAVVYVPNRSAAAIEYPTMHADILPTILAAAGIEVSNSSLFDGIDLYEALSRSRIGDQSDKSLSNRVIAVANYLGERIGLVDAATYDTSDHTSDPFMFHVAFSIFRWQLSPLPPLDEAGNAYPPSTLTSWKTRRLIDRWLDSRLGANESILGEP